MRYPKRAKTHIKESESWKILVGVSPQNWILRELTERDYGIDCYIEISHDKGYMTGELFSVQLKSIKKLRWQEKDDNSICTFSGIKVETINYWLGLPVPVFLLVADLQERKVFFCTIKEQIRRNYTAFHEQKSFGFQLNKKCELSTDIGNSLFKSFALERKIKRRLPLT